AGVRGITGAEVTVEDDLGRLCHATLLARTGEGYANLCRLITESYRPRGATVGAGSGRARRPAGREVVPGRPPVQAARVRGGVDRPDPMVTLDQLCAHAEGITLLTGCASRG